MSTKRQDKRADIARAAIAPLSVAGVRNVTLTDIGSSLGMTGAHLLYYFDSKVDLFMAALQMVEQDLAARVRAAFETMPSARDRWNFVLDAGAPAGLDDSGLLMWLEAWTEAVHDRSVHTLISHLETQWQSLLRETLEYAVKRGELPEDTDVDLITEGVSALLDGLTIRVVVGYRPVDHEKAMRVVNRFVGPLLPWQDVTGTGVGA
jgi:AcrR family transcriptional regulator